MLYKEVHLLHAIVCQTPYNRRIMKKKKPNHSNTIAQNKRARHEYLIEETFEVGLCLQGWEVKALRQGKANISESYVYVKNNEVFISGASIQPLNVASTHVVADPTRIRKLLMKRREIDKLVGLTERKGYTLVALNLYWSKAWAKLKIGVAKGKQAHDKRHDLKEKEWARDKQRMMKIR